MRTLLFTGPGGSGTTTLAAAAAVRAARAGRRTVLLTRQDVPVPGLHHVPGLDVVRVDPQTSLERLWGGIAHDLGPLLPQLSLPPSTSVVPLPGIGTTELDGGRGSCGSTGPRPPATPPQSCSRAACGSTRTTSSPSTWASAGTGASCTEIRTVRRPARAARTAADAATVVVPAPPGPVNRSVRTDRPLLDNLSPRRAS